MLWQTLCAFLDDQEDLTCDRTTPGRQTFSIENLSDCGLKTKQLKSFCSKAMQQFDCIKFSENAYVCS